MRKFQEYFVKLATIRAKSRGKVGKFVKQAIGDSINNNRTLTVSQLFRYSRYLSGTLDIKLEKVFKLLEKDILKVRNKRTDAIDINELVNVYRTQVIENRKYRRQIGSILKD